MKKIKFTALLLALSAVFTITGSLVLTNALLRDKESGGNLTVTLNTQNVTLYVDDIATSVTVFADSTVSQAMSAYNATNNNYLSDNTTCGWFYDADLTQPITDYNTTMQANSAIYTKMATTDLFTYTLSDDSSCYYLSKVDTTTTAGDIVFPATYNNLPAQIKSGTSTSTSAFYNCKNITSVTFSNKINTISDYSFHTCTGIISDVIIPEGVELIGSNSFRGCSKIPLVSIPSTVDAINSYAFYSCSSLSNLTLSDGVLNIGDYAFLSCTKITEINIPSSVVSVGIQAFASCSKLTTINVDSSNATYASDNGILYSADKTILVCYPAGKTDTYFFGGEELTNIGESAFYKCTNLTNVYIGKNVTRIEKSAFYGCTGIVALGLYESTMSTASNLEFIGFQAFYGCSGITRVDLPNTLTTIEGQAFNSTNLTSVTGATTGWTDSSGKAFTMIASNFKNLYYSIYRTV